MTISDLIAKLEAATGPSKELDARIYAELLHPHAFVRMADIDHHSRDKLSYVWYDSADNRVTCWGDKAFTHSIDAAMTLLPVLPLRTDGTWWNLQQFAGPLDSDKEAYQFKCGIQMVEGKELHEHWGIHVGAPIAICIAALRACKVQQ